MKYLAIEYTVKGVSPAYKAYIRYPDDMSGNWYGPFLEYLKAEKNAVQIDAYPLNVTPTPDDMGLDVIGSKSIQTGYKNIDNEFYNALADTKYFPRTDFYNSVRRSFSKLDLLSSQYNIKAQL